MNIKLLATFCLFSAPSASAFVMPKARGTSAVLRKASIGDEDPSMKRGPGFDPQDLLSKLSSVDMDFDFKALNLETIKNNVMDGNVGERGEAYAAAQFALLLFIVGGGVPLIGNLLMTLLGPVLMLAGCAAFALSVKDLGNSISPWVVPSEGGDLVREGIYSKLRHPQYAGLLAALAGFSIVTGSASRLLLTAVLYLILNQMADMEEEQLADKYPGYYSYKNQVPGKFFPDDVVQQLPWNKE
jgi:protein-S-isoprenylcysteine O-methyltransferase Ste14